MNLIELAFPVLGRQIPVDHGYLVYSAISLALDGHLPQGVSVAPIKGLSVGDGSLRVDGRTRLRLRVPAEKICELLVLAGKSLDIGGSEVMLGVPQARVVEPAATLQSRLVTIKGFMHPDPFLEAVARQLAALGVDGRAEIPAERSGPRKGEPRRRVLRIKGKAVVGFALRVRGLSEAGSMSLLTHGLGGRRHMGCGVFEPVRRPEGGHL
jgi:CRISPR-associated protein Cas6